MFRDKAFSCSIRLLVLCGRPALVLEELCACFISHESFHGENEKYDVAIVGPSERWTMFMAVL